MWNITNTRSVNLTHANTQGVNLTHANTQGVNLTYTDHHVKDLPILIPVIFVGLVCMAFNLFTITVIMTSRKLRRPANYPLVSVLLGAAMQSLFTIPLYVYRGMEESTRHQERWICDLYRLPYFLCGHLMKASLLVLSFDRLVATKCPYRYIEVVTKKRLTVIMLFIWAVVTIVDLIPFLPFGKLPNEEGCTYVPTKLWGLSVITVFDILPFVVIICCYVYIWKVAAGIFLRDLQLQESVHTNAPISKDVTSTRNSSGIEDTLMTGVVTDTRNSSVVSGTRNSNNVTDSGGKEEINGLSSGYNEPIKSQDESRCILGSCGLTKQRSEQRFSNAGSGCSMKSMKSTRSFRFAFEMKATRTSFMIVTVYLLCWGPLGILYAIDHYCSNCLSSSNEKRIALARFVVKIISLCSSVFIPLVYCWRTKEFQSETKRLVRKLLPWRTTGQGTFASMVPNSRYD